MMKQMSDLINKLSEYNITSLNFKNGNFEIIGSFNPEVVEIKPREVEVNNYFYEKEVPKIRINQIGLDEDQVKYRPIDWGKVDKLKEHFTDAPPIDELLKWENSPEIEKKLNQENLGQFLDDNVMKHPRQFKTENEMIMWMEDFKNKMPEDNKLEKKMFRSNYVDKYFDEIQEHFNKKYSSKTHMKQCYTGRIYASGGNLK